MAEDILDELTDKMGILASALEGIMQVHEKEQHDGEYCWDERANIIAFLAHRLGVSFGHYKIRLLLEAMIAYNDNHPNRTTPCLRTSAS